jgi:hypothetical protein
LNEIVKVRPSEDEGAAVSARAARHSVMSESSVTFHAHGMHCHGCEHIIETTLK